jgi:hypothetical protein
MTAAAFPDMHDWTFLAADYDWSSARVTMRFRTAVGDTTLVASEVADLHIPQRCSWGPSASVNGADLSVGTGKDAQTLLIEMQSGDVITIEAAAIEVR